MKTMAKIDLGPSRSCSTSALNSPVKALLFIFLLSCTLQAQGGRVDWTFQQLLLPEGNVTAIEVQPNGKILVAGKFTTVGPIVRKDLIRLNSDGSIDSSFDSGTGTDGVGMILALKVQTDGKIFIAGSFNSYNGTFVRALTRLNENGTIDNTFGISGLDVTFAFDVDIQNDGKVIISASNLIGSQFIARLGTTGANDGGVGQPFFLDGSSGYRVGFISPENKILATGRRFSPSSQVNILKIAVTGGADMTFTTVVTGNPNELMADAVSLANGKILVWGKFDAVNQVARRNVAILNSDGSVDSAFDPATSGSETIQAAAVQPDGKVVIAGTGFSALSAVHGNVARLNANGNVDPTFNAGRGADRTVKSIVVRNSKLLIGGDFFRFHTFPRAGLTQLKL